MMTAVLRASAGGTACATKRRSWGTKTKSWGTKSRSWGTTTSPVVAVVGQAVPPARPVGGDCFQRRRRDAR